MFIFQNSQGIVGSTSALQPALSGRTLTLTGSTWLAATGDSSGSPDVSAINTAFQSYAKVELQPGNWYLAAPVTVPNGGILVMDGVILAPGSAWAQPAETALIIYGGDNCKVVGGEIYGGTGSTTLNPVAAGIDITGRGGARVVDVSFANVNGWMIRATGTAAAFCADMMIRGVKGRNCAGGISDTGAAGTSFHGEHFYSDIQLQQMGVSTGAAANLDAFLIEDVEDVLVQGINVGMAPGGGSGRTIHVVGACATIEISNPDVGGAQVVVTIEDGPNGSPTNVQLINGVIQESTAGPGLEVTGAAVDITCTTMRFSNNWTHGASLDGTGTPIRFVSCAWRGNNQGGAAAAYDINATQTALFYVKDSGFHTAVSATPAAGVIPAVINDQNHQGIVEGCEFAGVGSSPSVVFTSTGTPQIVRASRGYNPRGGISAPAIGAAPFTTNSSQNDLCALVFTSVAGVTALKINGTNYGAPIVGVPYAVAARSPIEVDGTWTSTPPTWFWVAA